MPTNPYTTVGIGIRRNFATLGDRNFEPQLDGVAVQYISGKDALEFMSTGVTISKYKIALAPILPMVWTLPVPAIPTTNVANNNGAMIVLIKRRNMVPSSPSSLAGPGNIAPNAMPATRAIRIQVVIEIFFSILLPAPPFQFLAQDVEEQHI